MNPIDLERRVRRLEALNRFLLAGLALVAALPFLAGAYRAQSVELLSAQRIQVVDSEGRVRIDLRHDAEETGMFVMDDQGDTRLGAAQFAHGGGGYALHGAGGRGAAVLYLKGDGSLSMYDADGAVTARLPAAGRAP